MILQLNMKALSLIQHIFVTNDANMRSQHLIFTTSDSHAVFFLPECHQDMEHTFSANGQNSIPAWRVSDRHWKTLLLNHGILHSSFTIVHT